MKQGLLPQLVRVCVAALFVITSLVVSKTTLDPVLLPRWTSALVFLSLLSFLTYGLFSKSKVQIDFPNQKVFWTGFLGFTIAQLGSIFYALNIYEAMFTSFKWVTWLYLIFVLFQLIKQQIISEKFLVNLLIYCGLIISIVGLLQYLGIDLYRIGAGGRELKGTMGNPNLMGSFLVIIFPLGFYGLLAASKNERILKLAFLLFVFIATILSGSRTAYLILFIELVFCGIYYFKNYLSLKLLYWLIPSVLLVLIGVSLVIYKQLDIYNFGALISTGTIKTRTTLFTQTMQMVSENPWLGVGSGNWKIFIAKYGLDAFPEAMQGGAVSYVRPHNDYLWVLAENGIVGFSFFCLFIIGTIRLVARTLKRNLVSQQTLYLGLSLLAFLLAALVDYPSERNLHLMAFGAVVSIFLANQKNEESENSIPRITFVFLGFGMLFFTYFSTQRIKGEQFSKQILAAYQTQNGKAMQRLFNNLDFKYYNLDPISNPIPFFKAMTYFSSKSLKLSIAEFENALKIHPYHLLTLNNLGAMYKNDGQLEKAKEYYNKALLISPNYEIAKLNILELKFLTENIKEATLAFQQFGFEKTDPSYSYFFELMLKKQVNYALIRYPQLKQDKKYMEVLQNKVVLEKMYFGSLKNEVPFHIWILPFMPDSVPPIGNVE